jgi:uncharacterized membrane protein YfcA
VTPFVLIAIALIVAFAAGTQSITGFGFALIAVPGLALLLGPKVAVVAMSSVGVPLVIWNAVRWRHDILWREAITTSVAAWVGMPIGLLVLTHANDRVLTATIGVTILLLTVWLWRGLTVPKGRPTELAAGFVSGTLSTSVGTNGPPMVIAFQAVGLEPKPFRATLQACFVGQGSIALALFWSRGLVDHDVGVAFLVGAPAAVIGALLGDRIAPRVHAGPFRNAVLILLALSGALALGDALFG